MHLKEKSVRKPDCVTLSIADSAALLGVSAGLVRLEIKRGNLRPVRIGGRVLLIKAELDRHLGLAQ
jgi:excisionase family DNA binding protein